MSRLTDAQVRGKGTAVAVQNVEDLLIYHGKLKPLFSAPCDNWFEDIDPPERVPTGYIAIRQLSTGCLAFLPKDKLEALDYSKYESETLDYSKYGSETLDDSKYESDTLDYSNNESETLDRSDNKRDKLGRSKKKRRWDSMDVLDTIFSILFPKWW
ncbi:MAG: hypothetical protein F4W92_09240 [Gammaproteobacteria bacterium]|nr:hypothetical protein [Gammaproteobacteria bacterium]